MFSFEIFLRSIGNGYFKQEISGKEYLFECLEGYCWLAILRVTQFDGVDRNCLKVITNSLKAVFFFAFHISCDISYCHRIPSSTVDYL